VDLPEYITPSDLSSLLAAQELELPPPLAQRWQTVRCTPFVASFGSRCHFVVARDDARVIFFADDEDEFGTATLAPDGTLTLYGLMGDLRDALATF
jgi:hypothetical protein